MKSVFCTFQVAGFHCWPTAPYPYKYLSLVHRHVFHVRVDVCVTEDRGTEFIALKTVCTNLFMDNCIDTIPERFLNLIDGRDGHNFFGSKSCEHMAEILATVLRDKADIDVLSVEVNEDGENGGKFEFR